MSRTLWRWRDHPQIDVFIACIGLRLPRNRLAMTTRVPNSRRRPSMATTCKRRGAAELPLTSPIGGMAPLPPDIPVWDAASDLPFDDRVIPEVRPFFTGEWLDVIARTAGRAQSNPASTGSFTSIRTF